MPALHRPRRQSGFTLVELLIVVIILAILAAIVIPQFSGATKDTQEAALDSNLAAIRNAIELYKAQHDTYPGAAATSGGTCPTGATTGSTAATASTELAFKESLTMYSDKTGKTCSVQSDTAKYGPYIRKAIPNEPISGKADVVVTATGAPIVPTAATGGWAYDTKSGQIVANTNAKDKDGTGTEYYRR